MTKGNNISSLGYLDCCGCRACGDGCPVGCISFEKDKEGFFYPIVDETACIHCGKCVRICPEFNPQHNETPDKVIAAYAESEEARRQGSSGGLFGVIATYIIKQGGKVWGAAFDGDLKLRHTCATKLEELKPLMRSKYLQSDSSGCYAAIADDLKKNILTLFVGTPCQCNALRNFIGKECEHLNLIDLICHGVPSQDLFDRSIKWLEDKKGIKVIGFSFRSKYKGALHPQAFSYSYVKNGKMGQVNGLHYQFPFYFGFQKYITLRPACYRCKWACTQRAGDITLGDFWGVEKLNEGLDSKTGISEVIVNTAKGHKLIHSIAADSLIWTQEFAFEQVADSNGCLQSPTPLKAEREALFNCLENEPFDDAVKKHLVSKRQWIFNLYYGMPEFLRKIVRKIMDKRMRYE